MKVKCDDGMVRRFTLPYNPMGSDGSYVESVCIECGTPIGISDTNRLKQLAKQHTSCKPNPESEEPRSLVYWLKKWDLHWNEEYKKRDMETWMERNDLIWFKENASRKVEELLSKKSLFRLDPYRETIKQFLERIRS